MNTSQQILTALGVDPFRITFIRSGKQPQHCKKGPGRKHMQGMKIAEDRAISRAIVEQIIAAEYGVGTR